MTGSITKLKRIMPVCAAFVTLLLAMVTPAIGAYAKEYVGAYESMGSTIYAADRVLFITKFEVTGTGPTADILSVLSTAGSSSTSVSGVNGWEYQTFSVWENEDPATKGTISGQSEVWQPSFSLDTPRFESGALPVCNINNMGSMVNNAVWSSDKSQITFIHHCIHTDGTASGTQSPVYTKHAQDTSQYFLVGKCDNAVTGNHCATGLPTSFKARFLQVGVENSNPTNNFIVTDSRISFLQHSPRQVIRSPALNGNYMLTETNLSWYTDTGGTKNAIFVGTGPFDNVHVRSQKTTDLPHMPPGQLQWYSDGSTCTGGRCYSEDTSLWDANAGGVKTVGTTSSQNSPATGDSYEGEKRLVVSESGAIFAFYYDTSNNGIVQKKSTDGGNTWSALVPLNTGTIVSDSYRWTLTYTWYLNVQYVYVFYWVQGNPDTTNMHFKFMRGTVASDGNSISWSSAVELGFVAQQTGCGSGGACAAAVATTDSNGVLYAAFTWKAGTSLWAYQIKTSSNGGFDWSDSLSQTNISDANRLVIGISAIDSGKVVFTYTSKSTQLMLWRVYKPGSGWSLAEGNSIWSTANVEKQYSIDTDPMTHIAYIAFVSSGTSGTLNVHKLTYRDGISDWGANGVTEGADTTISTHQLPSISITPDGDIQIYTLAGSTLKVYETTKAAGAWNAPTNPYGTTFSSPNQLTANIWYPNAMWREGTTAPYSIKFPYAYG